MEPKFEIDFSKEDLNRIRMGVDPEWRRVGDASAYGGVYKSPKHPGKVIKVQSGYYKTYDNEIDKQFQAQLKNVGEYEVPALAQSGFIPNDPSAPTTYDPKTKLQVRNPMDVGTSYIMMDEADFATVAGAESRQKHAKAKGLTSLYKNAGVSHADDHAGNIKYNPKTDKPVLLDFGLANKVNGPTNSGKRTQWIQDSLKHSGNTDMLELWDEQHYELQQEHMVNQTKESAADLEDWRKQGQDVALMTDPDDAPVNWSDDAPQTPQSTRDSKTSIQREGAQNWVQGKGNKRYPTMSPPRMPGTSWFEGHLKAVDNLRSSLFELTPKKFQASPIAGALSVGAADLIPSRESIKTAAKDGLVPALKQHGKEFALSLPVAASIGFTSAAVPAVATAAALAAPGLVAVAGAEAVDETVKQHTGEGVVPKLQQALGTKKRTGIASPGGSIKEQNQREQARVDTPPQIKPLKYNQRRPIKDTPIPALAHRLRLAGDRFNPSKGEFGLSELIFGR